MVATAEQWRWSSAAAHCGSSHPDTMVAMESWRKRWTAAEWRGYLGEEESGGELESLRQATHTGRPLGSAEFVKALEELTSRRMAARKGGRPKKMVRDDRQEALVWGG